MLCTSSFPGLGVSPALCLDLCVFADGGFSCSHALTRGNGFGDLLPLWRQWGCVRAAVLGQAPHTAYHLLRLGFATPGSQFSLTVKWDDVPTYFLYYTIQELMGGKKRL